MRRRQFLQGAPAVFGATLTGKATANIQTSPAEPALERVAMPMAELRARETHIPRVLRIEEDTEGGEAEPLPLPVIGLGESGRTAIAATILGGGPHAEYWRLVESAAASGGGHSQEGPPSPDPEAVSGTGAVRDALNTLLVDAPIAIFMGDPQEPFVAEQAQWLADMLPRTGCRALWVRPPEQPNIRESPLPGPLLEPAAALQDPDQTTFVKLGKPEGYYTSLLWGLVAPFESGSLIGVDISDTYQIVTGKRAVFAKAIGTSQGERPAVTRHLAQQIRNSEGGLDDLAGFYFQVWGTITDEVSIRDFEVLTQKIEEELGIPKDSDMISIVGMPLGEYPGFLEDRVAVSLVAIISS